MTDPIPCEQLVTKSEFEAFKQTIINLLGEKDDDSGDKIDILSTGTLTGTILAGTIVKAKEAIVDLQISGTVKDSLERALAKGDAQWVKVKGSGARTPLPDLSKISTTSAKAAQTATATAVATRTVSAGAQLALTLGSALVQAVVNRKQQELNQLILTNAENAEAYRNSEYSGILKLIAKNKENIADAEAELLDVQQQIADANQQIESLNIGLEASIETDEILAEKIEENEDKVLDALQAYDDLKVQYKNFEKEAISDIESLEKDMDELSLSLENSQNNQDLMLEYLQNTAIERNQLQARVTEIQDRISRRELLTTVQLAEVRQLQQEYADNFQQIDNDLGLIDSRFEDLESKVLANSKVSNNRGGGFPVSARDSLTTTQNKQIETTAKLAGVDPETIEGYPILDYQVTAYDNPFSSIINSLIPQITPGQGGDFSEVEYQELSDRLSTDIDNTLTTGLVALTALTNQINLQTTPEAITNAAENAVCNTTAPTGCLTQNLRNPLQQGQNTIQNLVNNVLQGLDLFQGQAILDMVTNTNNFMKTAWSNLRVNKLLDYLNTILLVHNAAMLSKNLAASLGDSISALANNTIDLIKNEDGSDIDINATIGTSLEQFLINLLGQENYTDINQTFQKSSRILNAATNIINTIQFSLAGLAEGLETVGNYTGRIGNSLKKAGAVFENAYGWMNETFRVKTGRLGQIQSVIDGLESVENITSDLENVSYEFREVQENVTQIGGEFNKIKTEVATKETEKTNLETITKTNSQGAQPTANDYTPDPVN